MTKQNSQFAQPAPGNEHPTGMRTVTRANERRCDAWEAAGERLRAAVAWRVFQGKGDVLSAITGVPTGALTRFVETGELDAVHRSLLEVSAGFS